MNGVVFFLYTEERIPSRTNIKSGKQLLVILFFSGYDELLQCSRNLGTLFEIVLENLSDVLKKHV